MILTRLGHRMNALFFTSVAELATFHELITTYLPSVDELASYYGRTTK